ncbi:outer membrane lipoprotein carrier protein [Desulfacinum hydrothermale DSM 13146]|uniref:Outer membrane lipoprotein carrier protein n=1 Tax=Desulfacinum hydrothermale DSM 13146 TaxID=1121390 RepID=A0A1W1XL16_9BACT|nr:outer membrane lipoprotein carrier protein LolA [Desulfacinum hydrothermale]SMC24507.1 outer membrane lipoprotein carrier protein [Desulfacinum hydrothermale DSM 13146]
MNRKRDPILFLFLLTAVALLVTAPPKATADTGSPATVRDILRHTQARYHAMSAYTADFTQWTTSVAASSITTEARGIFYFQKPNRMRWEYTEPDRQVFVTVGDVAWLYLPEEKQVSLFDAQQMRRSPIMRTLLEGTFDLSDTFHVSLDTKASTDEMAVLTLRPRAEDPNVQSLRLWIQRQDYRVWQMEVRDALGNVNRIRLTHHREMPSLPADLFQLSVDPQTLVIDPAGRPLQPAEISALQRAISK